MDSKREREGKRVQESSKELVLKYLKQAQQTESRDGRLLQDRVPVFLNPYGGRKGGYLKVLLHVEDWVCRVSELLWEEVFHA